MSGMFDELRDAFREAVKNFKRELDRDHIPETVDRLLAGMRDEAADALAHVRRLEEDLEKSRGALAREKEGEATCRRREEMAKKIGDEETARVAAEYHEKHARRVVVLQRKVEALEQERALGKAEVEEMLVRIKEASRDRDGLAATMGRVNARDSIRQVDDLFAELDRMAEKVGDDERREAAEESLDRDVARGGGGEDDLTIDLDAPPRAPVDVDARLAELKRRMGKE